MAQIETAIFPKRVRRMWGLDLDSWNNIIVGFLALGAAAAIVVGIATYIAFELQKQEAKDANDALEKYKSDAAIQISAANRETAKLNERAKDAELKLEQLRQRVAPREINGDVFLETLRDQPKAKVDVLYLKDDPECFSAATQLFMLLAQAKWEVRSPMPIIEPTKHSLAPAPLSIGAQPSGISIVARSLDEQESLAIHDWIEGREPRVRTARVALSVAIRKAMGAIGTGGAGANRSVPDGTLWVVVGPKM